MIYSVDFKEMAGKISYVNVAKYLNDLGWNEFNTKRNNIKIFQYTKNEVFYQVDLPIDRNLIDYNMAMFKAVEIISDSLNKSVEQVILELLNPLSDILRIRVKDKEVENGSILMEDALKLYDNAKKLLAATAMDIINPKIIHLGRIDDKIQEFIGNCRFGQTEIGSYVVSLVCPFANIDNGKYMQLSLFSEQDVCANSLTREVTKKLISSIKVVKEAVNKGKLEAEILNKVNISSNFLEALNSINIYKPESQLDISVKWAPTIRKNILDFDSISITHDYYEPISAVVDRIKNNQEGIKSYIGRISKLESNEDPQKREHGTITLVYFNDNMKIGTATTSLAKDDYERAIEAHQEGKLVKITGTMIGQTRKKIKDSSFEVIDG